MSNGGRIRIKSIPFVNDDRIEIELEIFNNSDDLSSINTFKFYKSKEHNNTNVINNNINDDNNNINDDNIIKKENPNIIFKIKDNNIIETILEDLKYLKKEIIVILNNNDFIKGKISESDSNTIKIKNQILNKLDIDTIIS
jgi:hypothetical protein